MIQEHSAGGWNARKHRLGVSVLQASERRMAWIFDRFSKVCVSCSGGKDSTVLLHLALAEARRRGRRIGVLLVDLEAQYKLTIDHLLRLRAESLDAADWYWVSLPIILRNAVSSLEPRWLCWDPARTGVWVRTPPTGAIVDETYFSWFKRGMEFEEFVPLFAEWYAGGQQTCFLVGIRAGESLNRQRTLFQEKARYHNVAWTTVMSDHAVNAYPIYDWNTSDIWVYHARTGTSHNPIYDRMHRAGLTISQMRLCQPYGDDQRQGLWLFHVLEPETWGKIVSRVAGANQGSLYAGEIGNILGNNRVKLPAGHTWQSFSELLLNTLPPRRREMYSAKIAVFLTWWQDKGYPEVPDSIDPSKEASREAPSWRRICRAILRNDYWCKGLGFSQQKSGWVDQYLEKQKVKRHTPDLPLFLQT